MNKSDKQLLIEDQMIYRYYRERLMNLALSQFKWYGFPETCDRWFFERSLLLNGKACFCMPKGTDFWLSPDFVNQGKLDVYGYPTKIRGVGVNTRANIETDTWEILYDNMTRTSLMPMIDLYAKMLWECHQVFRSNLQQQITPYVVLTTKDQELSFRNLFARVFGFQRVIAVKNNFDPDAIRTLDMKVDYKGQELLESLKVIWAEALAMLGITAETTKKERLLNNEIALDRMEDIISLNSRMLNRVEFANKMNKKYGFDLSVNLSSQDTELTPFGFTGDYAMAELQQADDSGSKSTTINEGGKKDE